MANSPQPPRAFPPVIAGFVLLALFPALLATIDVGAGALMAYPARLVLWNLPWIYAGIAVLFALWIDTRRTGQRWMFLSLVDRLWLAGLVAMAFVLSRMRAANPELADLILLRYVLALGLGVAAYYGMRHYQARFSRPVYFAILAGSALVTLPLFYFLYATPARAIPGEVLVWHMPGFGAVRVFGMVLEAGVAIGVGLLAMARGRVYSAVILAATVALWAMLLWSGGRGAVLSLGVAMVIVSAVYPQHLLRLWLVFLGTGLLGSGLSLLIWVPDTRSLGFLNMFLKTTSGGVEGAIGTGRIEHWAGAWGLIRENPFAGYGLGQYSNLWTSYAQADAHAGIEVPFYFLPYRNVHNIVLEIVLSWGIFGGAVALWLLGKAWIGAVRPGQALERLPALLGLNALLFHTLVSGAYLFAQSLFYMAIFFGICLVPNFAHSKNTNM